MGRYQEMVQFQAIFMSNVLWNRSPLGIPGAYTTNLYNKQGAGSSYWLIDGHKAIPQKFYHLNCSREVMTDPLLPNEMIRIG